MTKMWHALPCPLHGAAAVDGFADLRVAAVDDLAAARDGCVERLCGGQVDAAAAADGRVGFLRAHGANVDVAAAIDRGREAFDMGEISARHDLAAARDRCRFENRRYD